MDSDASSPAGIPGFSLTLSKTSESSITASISANSNGGEGRVLLNGDNSNSQEYFQLYCEQEILDNNLKVDVMMNCMWAGCDRRFPQLDDLANHVNDDHVKMEKETDYTCRWEGCSRNGKAFNARYKMLIHVRTHTHEKPHLCRKCGKPFSRLENLKIHNRSHTGEKPYVCTVDGCTKAYSNSSDRFKHTRTHFVDKPYICRKDGCNKRYTDPSSLRKHMKAYGHYREGTEVTPAAGKEKLPSHKEHLHEQTAKTNGEKQVPVSAVAQTTLNAGSVLSAEPILMVSVASLISNPMLSSTVHLKSEMAKSEQHGLDLERTVFPAGANGGSAQPITESAFGTNEQKGQAGPLDLTVNQGLSDSNLGVTNGTTFPMKWEFSPE